MSTLTGDEIMDRAADLIDGRGLCYGEFQDETGAVCMLAALRLADNPDDKLDSTSWGDDVVGKTVMLVVDFIQESLEDDMSIPDWNDFVCENQYAATEMLRTQAKYWREDVGR